MGGSGPRRPALGESLGGWSLGPAASGTPTPAVDDVDRYTREALLAEGGMGRVYLAFDRRLDRWVAIKEALAPGASSEALEREARLTAGLDHPGVVAVHDVGRTDDARPFYTMRLVRGRTLSEILAERPDAAHRRALLTHFRDACHALGSAHAQGIVHRDVKPANLMIGEFGETRVVDWGLAVRVGEPHDGAVVGTPSWLSPEQARGEPATPRADVWGLGAVLYQLLAGQAPYSQASTDVALAAARDGQPAPIGELAPDAPPELKAIVTKAMSPRPEDRYPDASALAGDIERYLTGDRVDAHPYTPRELLVRLLQAWRAPLTVGALAVVVVTGLVVWSAQRLTTERDRALVAEADANRAAQAALVAQARQAMIAGATGRAGAVAVEALAHGEHPEARGALVAAWSQRPVRRVASEPIGPCPGAALSVDGVLCTDSRSVWRMSGGVERWRVVAPAVELTASGPVFAVSLPRTAQLRDLATGALLGEQDRRAALPLAGTDDGRFASRRWEGESWSGGLDRSTWTWHTGCDGHGLPRESVLHRTRALHASWCADGQVAISEGTAPARLFDTGLPIPVHGDVASLAFDAAGDRLALGYHSGRVAVLDLTTGVTTSVPATGPSGVAQVAFAPDGRLLATRLDGGGVDLWSTHPLVPVASLPVDDVRTLGWQAGTGRLRLVSDRLDTWAVDPSSHLPVVRDDRGVSGVDFSPDGATLLTAHGNGLVMASPTAGGPPTLRRMVGDGTIMGARYTPDGTSIVAHAGETRGVRRFSATGDAPGLDRLGDGQYRAIAPLADGVVLGMAFGGGVERLTADGVQVLTDCGQKEWHTASVGPDGRHATLVGVDGEVVIATGDACGPALPGVVARRAVLIGDDGLIVADATSLSRLGTDGVVRWRVALDGTTLALAVDPTGRWVAAGGVDQAVRVFAAGDGRAVAVLRGQSKRVSSVAFSPDGRWLASGSWDGTTHLWAVAAFDLDALAARATLADRGWPSAGDLLGAAGAPPSPAGAP